MNPEGGDLLLEAALDRADDRRTTQDAARGCMRSGQTIIVRIDLDVAQPHRGITMHRV
jgi:hypothetical protein